MSYFFFSNQDLYLGGVGESRTWTLCNPLFLAQISPLVLALSVRMCLSQTGSLSHAWAEECSSWYIFG